MLRKTIKRSLVIAGSVAALSMLTLSLVPPGTLGTIQLHEGYYVGHRVSVWANPAQLALAAHYSSACKHCSVHSIGPWFHHLPGCPLGPSFPMTIEPEPLQPWFSSPGMQIRVDPLGLFGFGVSATWWFLTCLFALYPAIAFFLWLRARRRVPPGHCPKCAYKTTGNTSDVCPECGTPTVPRP